ncbi:hypothetical protein CGCF415_v004484 [Colletotrichum fructicola]|uniref:Uncharacterized protein n=1 Tax=Colletotrichum fructicola (strain Nara gc5) TaxID=1213859 RepID=L2GD20_COLFN|nr:uncharacterized protein CGMCC3_g15671 [Colletotrichum fructicola]KAF4480572.1 hypothetical protein CGGC5_v011062 [Colletotrichum fructicola Nara gc5]KAI8283581.1 hypothetical protein K4K60_002607 [Colletotrichum sp. SAR11_57]KAE9568183.1 hypothetical protein CGMCC3_g15671 [Colletotrichum fructicola]KAF4412581.1 hypothetical protein CFRS1_v002712 [Colletotrichum fructicola]KAF4901162.1 hypothetical protein CGCFRS4_v002907 [Colletotrichum fructicola]
MSNPGTIPDGDEDMMTATAPFKNSLETAPNAGSPDSKAHTEPNHSNPYNTEQQLTTSTGGLSIEDKIEGELRRSDRQQRVEILAGLFLQTCAGDWSNGIDVGLCGHLHSVVDGKKFDSHFDIIAVICFRWQLACLADDLIGLFGLSKLNGETCLMWRYHDWKFSAGAVFQPFGERYGAVWGRFLRSSCELRPTKGQRPRFYRFLQYMTAAAVEADLGVHATEALVDKLAQYIIAEKKKLQDQGFQDKETHHRGRDWIKSVGRTVHRSLSPHKSRKRSNTATSRHSC